TDGGAGCGVPSSHETLFMRRRPMTHNTQTASSFIVENRYEGPPNYGNGGYVAGRLAALLGAPQAVISLMRPAPVDTPLSVAASPSGGLALMEGDQPVLTAVADDTPINVPQTLVLDRA